MAYSTIKRKHCKCEEGCKKMPSMGFSGYYYAHAPQEIKDKQGLKAKRGYQNSLSRTRSNALAKKVRSYGKENVGIKTPEIKSQEQWYLDRRDEMLNVCAECGAGTNVKDDKYYRWSVCHIVPKSLVPSVATYEHNWIELCQHHHQEFDNTFDRAAAMKCFQEAKMKFRLFQKLIPANELRKVNPHLLT